LKKLLFAILLALTVTKGAQAVTVFGKEPICMVKVQTWTNLANVTESMANLEWDGHHGGEHEYVTYTTGTNVFVYVYKKNGQVLASSSVLDPNGYFGVPGGQEMAKDVPLKTLRREDVKNANPEALISEIQYTNKKKYPAITLKMSVYCGLAD